MKKLIYKTFYKCLIFLLILICFNTYSQNRTIDSLNILLKKDKEDTTKVNHLYSLCKEYITLNKYDTALFLETNSLQLSERLNFKKGIAKSYLNIGIVYSGQNNYLIALNNYFKGLKIAKEISFIEYISDFYKEIGAIYYYQNNYYLALDYYFKALKIKKEMGDKKAIASLYNNIGLINKILGNYSSTIDYYFKSLKINEDINNKKGVAYCYNNIGVIYQDQDNFSDALDYYHKALKIRKEINDKKGIASSYNNIGAIYIEQNKCKLALECFFYALKTAQEIANQQSIATAYNCIGMAYQTLSKNNEALNYFHLALKKHQEIGNKSGSAGVYCNIGVIYSKLNQPLLAIKYFNKSLEIDKEIGRMSGIEKTYLCLSDAYARIKNYQKAFEYHKLYLQLKDTLLNNETSKKIAQMQALYNTEKKDKEIFQLKTEQKIKEFTLREEQNKKKLAYCVVGGIIIITVIGLFIFTQKRKTKNQLEISELKFISLNNVINPHFIFNALNSIQAYIQLNDIRKSLDYISKFSRLVRSILENAEDKSISIQQEVERLNIYLQLENERLTKKIKYSILVSNNIDKLNETIPNMIIQPFIENAIIHGIQLIQYEGLIEINIDKNETNYSIQITDNGIGINNNTNQNKAEFTKKSVAIQNIKKRLHLIHNSKLEIVNNALFSKNGTTVIINIPIGFK